MLGAGAVASAALSQPASAQETPVVKMDNNYFDTIGPHVEPGTTVRFEIAAEAHSATAYENRIPSAASGFDRGIISSGGFEYTFEEPGTYDYYCILHKSVGMAGRIVVGSPGGPAEESLVPDGDVPESDANVVGALMIAVVESIFGALYERTGNLAVPVLVHATYNTILFGLEPRRALVRLGRTQWLY